jgi:hypothetical protein
MTDVLLLFQIKLLNDAIETEAETGANTLNLSGRRAHGKT